MAMMATTTRSQLKDVVTFVAETIGRPYVSDIQLDIIEYFGKGMDVFVCLPTGAGKSLTFMAAPFTLDWGKTGMFTPQLEAQSIVIIVSPLIELMQEQTKFLTSNGLKAVYIGEEETDVTAVNQGQYNYVFGRPRPMSKVSISHFPALQVIKSLINARDCFSFTMKVCYSYKHPTIKFRIQLNYIKVRLYLTL